MTFCRTRARQGFQRGWGRGVPTKLPDLPEMKLLETAQRNPNLKDFFRKDTQLQWLKKSLSHINETQIQRPNEKHISPLTKGTQLRTENEKLRIGFPFIIKRPCQSIPS